MTEERLIPLVYVLCGILLGAIFPYAVLNVPHPFQWCQHLVKVDFP
jgi:hypothetical protein